MATKKSKGPAPAPLDPKVAKKLLNLLSTDNEFRRLFKKDAPAALAKAGWKAPAGDAAASQSAGECMQMQATDSIAPKANIIRDRAKLEDVFTQPFRFTFDCPQELKK